MLKILAGIVATVGSLGYITWFVEDILKVPKEDQLKNRSLRFAKELWNGSKDMAQQTHKIRKAVKAERQANRKIPDFSRTVLVESHEPNVEVDSRGRRFVTDGSLFD